MSILDKATLAAFNKAVDIGFKKVKKNPQEGMLDIVNIFDKYLIPKSDKENSGKKAIERIRRVCRSKLKLGCVCDKYDK